MSSKQVFVNFIPLWNYVSNYPSLVLEEDENFNSFHEISFRNLFYTVYSALKVEQQSFIILVFDIRSFNLWGFSDILNSIFFDQVFYVSRMFAIDISSVMKLHRRNFYRRIYPRPISSYVRGFRMLQSYFWCTLYIRVWFPRLYNSGTAKVYTRYLCEHTYTNYESMCIDHCCSSPLLK